MAGKKINIDKWFNDLRIKRSRLYKDNKDTQAINIIGIVEKFHTEILHFVFELIQNADDTKANEASFIFKKNQIVFTHNGGEFTRSNVEKISSIGHSDKSEDQIGKFGMGFKSVYKITNQPLIYSFLEGRRFNFKIRNEIIPEKIDKTDKFLKRAGNKRKSTIFILNINKAIPPDFNQKCNRFIKENGFKFLMFLNHLKKIKFSVQNNQYSFKKNVIGAGKIKIKSKKNNKKNEFNFFVYKQKVNFLKKNKKAFIVFAFHIGAVGHFFGTKIKTKLNIFLETHENTGLNFYIHAPFIPNNTRTEINLDDENNKKILDICVGGFSNLIEKLKKSKLLNISFIEVLPNCDRQNDYNKFEKLHVKIQETLLKDAIWPCSDKTYQIAKDVKFWGLKQENIFSNQDLVLLSGNSKARWLEESKNSRKSKILLQHLEDNGIRDRGIDLVNKYFSQGRHDFIIKNKRSLDWLFNFYMFMDGLKIYDLPIIKTDDGRVDYGYNVRFPSDLPKLDSLSYLHDDFVNKFDPKKRIKLRNYFKKCEVHKTDEHDEIKNLLYIYFPKANNYSTSSGNKQIDQDYTEYLDKLADYYKKYGDIDLLRSYQIFVDKNNNFCSHSEFFIDEERCRTYLSSIREQLGLKKMFIPKSAINKQKIIDLAKALGIKTIIGMDIDDLIFRNHKHPNWKKMIERFNEDPYYSLSGRRYTDEDNTIPFLDKLLEIISQTQKKEISYVIALRLSSTSMKERQARFKPRASYPKTETDKSAYMYRLMESNWIPQRDGSFQKPKDSNKESTDKKFMDLAKMSWLYELNFASSESIRENREKIERDDEKKHGLPPGSIKTIQGLTQEEWENLQKTQQEKRKKSITKTEDQEFETRSSPHPTQAKDDELRTEEKGSKYVEEENPIEGKKVKIKFSTEEDRILKENKRKLKETHYLHHCQICCLATNYKTTGNILNEDFLVKSLGKINRIKLMDVHHIHSIADHGPKTHLSNLIVLCKNHHFGFVESYGHGKDAKDRVYNLLKQSKEKTLVQLPKDDGTPESVPGYKIKMEKNDFELFFTETHTNEFFEQ